MATWTCAIFETGGRSDFWEVARKHGITASTADVPKFVLVDFDCGFDMHAPVRVAEALSRELSASSVALVAQTNADVHELHAFSSGDCVRRLAYSRDDGGWLTVEGSPQPWERAYFFDDEGSTSAEAGRWPDMLSDELSDEELARYESAKRDGDASTVLGLMNPSSTLPAARVCAFFGVRPDAPSGTWKKQSWWGRMFQRPQR